MDSKRIETAIRDILIGVGEDPERQGLQNTPSRVGKMYGELMEGYQVDPLSIVNGALFDLDYDDMVIVRDIEFYSLCEHHLLPFLGHAHIAYIPCGKVIGLSKIPRIVDMFAHRLQLQERMTKEIANFLTETIQPKGVAVVLEALHLCSTIRGVKKADARMITSVMCGVFKEDIKVRSEFMGYIHRPLHQEF